MIRSMFSKTLLSVCFVMGPVVAGACSSDSAGNVEGSNATGTLKIPLITTTGAHTYRLLASIEIYGSSFWTNIYTGNGMETVFSTTLPTGDYGAYMFGWTLERADENGNFFPVVATLISDYYVQFSIFNEATSSISYQFQTSGEIVTIGAGNLNVDFGVTETAPACVAFGDTCPTGSWCPPSELTGLPLACIAAGTLELGATCRSPQDCVANASCFDLGIGPVCAALCSNSELGSACGDGGTCLEAGSDYGVCVPEGGTPPASGGSGGEGSGGSAGFPGKGGGFPSAGGAGGV